VDPSDAQRCFRPNAEARAAAPRSDGLPCCAVRCADVPRGGQTSRALEMQVLTPLRASPYNAAMSEELSKRLDDFRADVNQRFAELREDVNQRFAGVDRRFDDLNHRFTTLTWVITVWGGLVTLLITLFGFFR